MKKCVVCGKEICEKRTICWDCEAFLKWKHNDKLDERIEEFKKLTDQPFNLRLTKFRRKK